MVILILVTTSTGCFLTAEKSVMARFQQASLPCGISTQPVPLCVHVSAVCVKHSLLFFLKLQGQSESPGKVVFLGRVCTYILEKEKRHDLRRVLSVPRGCGVSAVPSRSPCPAQDCPPSAAELWACRSALRPTWPPHVKQR